LFGCKTPSGNGSSGGHASGRGAPLLPAEPTDQVRFGKRSREAEALRHALPVRSIADGEGRRNLRASGRPIASHPPGRRVTRDAAVQTRADRRGRPFPSGPLVETFSASRSSRSSADRGVLWTGVEPVTPRFRAWCSTSELPRPESRPGSESLHGTRSANRPKTGQGAPRARRDQPLA
jgi:hypothetical protein